MHFAIKVIRQPAIVVQTTQVGAAHVADLQLLVAGGAGRVGEGFQLALLFFLGDFGGADFVEFGHGGRDAAGFAEDGDFEEAGVDRTG